jgi:hypothetical protein
MAQYAITLVIETDETQQSPDRWNWSEVLDTPLPVSVVACTPLPDDPTYAQVTLLRAAIQYGHNALVSRL